MSPFYTKILESVEQEAFKHNYILQYHVFCQQLLESPNLMSPILSATPSDCLIIIGRFKAETLHQLEAYSRRLSMWD